LKTYFETKIESINGTLFSSFSKTLIL
jgi:hypothetical protein